MVPCFSCHQITRCKANNSTITCSNSSFSYRGISTQVNTLSQRIAGSFTSFICRRLFTKNAHFRISSARAWFFPTGSLLLAFHIKFRNLRSSRRCLRNAPQVSLHCKKTTAFPMITDMGNFSFLGSLCQIKQWPIISKCSRLQ